MQSSAQHPWQPAIAMHGRPPSLLRELPRASLGTPFTVADASHTAHAPERTAVEGAGAWSRACWRVATIADDSHTHTHACGTRCCWGRRRLEQGFLGADKFLQPDGKLKKQARKRVGVAGMKAPARGHTEIFDAEGKLKIGEITSGTFRCVSVWVCLPAA
jgi:hypothetical protein